MKSDMPNQSTSLRYLWFSSPSYVCLFFSVEQGKELWDAFESVVAGLALNDIKLFFFTPVASD